MRTSTSACHPVIRPSRQTGQSLVSGAQSPLPRNVHEPADASGRRSLAGWSTFIPSKKRRKRSGVSDGERALSHQLSAVSLGHKETTKGRTEKEPRGERGRGRSPLPPFAGFYLALRRFPQKSRRDRCLLCFVWHLPCIMESDRRHQP